MAERADSVVSFDNEELILVDGEDREIGTLSKARCHEGDGVLHRAFSLFVFDRGGRLLLQQRSGQKRLWPSFWSNSCCSHPRRGETMHAAVERRLKQELDLSADLEFVYKFTYQARYGSVGSEHELCSVYLGRSDETAQANANEIAALRYVTAAELNAEMSRSPARFTPWFRMEWQQLRRDHIALLERFTTPAEAGTVAAGGGGQDT